MYRFTHIQYVIKDMKYQLCYLKFVKLKLNNFDRISTAEIIKQAAVKFNLY